MAQSENLLQESNSQGRNMIYKRLGRTGLEISRLSFGAMRLPKKGGEFDVEESVRIIHRAFELGVNYIDTAVMYCAHQSESIVGRALKGRRDKVTVSTKNHYMGTDEKAWWTNLENSLERLDVNVIDVYNLHGMNWDKWEKWVKGPNGILSWIRKAKDQGLITHICCSFHDKEESLRKIAATEEFSSITHQYNILDRSLEPAFEEIAERDIGIVVMGPVGGGRLSEPSEKLAEMVPGARSTAEVALRFVLANPCITAAISGMGSMEMVEENCAVGAREEPLSQQEHSLILETLSKIKGLSDLSCTGCNYCLPCPAGVNIPKNFTAMNTARLWGLDAHAERLYQGNPGKATFCISCGACEPKCPQKIPIREQLRETAKRFDPLYGKAILRLEPRKKSADGIETLAQIHNVGDQSAHVKVGLTSTEPVRITPSELESTIENAFTQDTHSLLLTPPQPGTATVTLTAEITDPTGKRTEEFPLTLGDCQRVDSLESLAAPSFPGEPIRIDAPEQVYRGGEFLKNPYSLEARCGYTPDSFLLRASIHDKPVGDFTDTLLNLILDLRESTGILPPGFHEGVFLLRTESIGSGKPSLRVLRGGLDADKATVNCSGDEEKSVVTLEVPWEAMGDRRPCPGECFRFEISFGGIAEGGPPAFWAGWHPKRDETRRPTPGTLFFAP